jgi:two-component system alkaline phosphatase synthesis response regulator PhoP
MDQMITSPQPLDFALIAERQAVRVGNQEIIFTRTQFRLLAVLTAEPGRAFRRADLVNLAIGTVVTERTIDAHVRELRRKLGKFGACIQTVQAVGYRWEPGASWQSQRAA